ncbi:protein NAR1-like isoform X1 [Juglans regia]|uniref:Protein NAR1-like isoform X1 n=1 Tax=Juglans regia TaxID=51240 RepID=A0A6P9E948_JUGRE|nr:protein NAR1-like isoform X1 [Juglans regia]
MSEKFSATLRIGDLSDFIAPSQACIVSLKGLKSNASKPDKAEVSTSNKQLQTDPVKISLKDCLACSGCVTSAETVMLEKQSLDEFLSNVKKGKAIIISVSPQSRASLAVHFGITPLQVRLKCRKLFLVCFSFFPCTLLMDEGKFTKWGISILLCCVESLVLFSYACKCISTVTSNSQSSLFNFQVFKKLTTFFKSLGVKAVFDTSCSRDLTLIESCNEFIMRYRQSQLMDDERCQSSLPMISSACPGWICYAEKQLGSYILPYVSSVKSPQQTIGSIVKHHVCQELGLRPDNVYHVTVMPCYDKKLEAAREDFVFQVESQGESHENGPSSTEVDSVLTSGEVLELIQLQAVDFKALEESPVDRMLTNVNEEGHLYGVHGSSGGYAETIFRYAAKTLFGREIDGPLDFRIIRNSDFQEVTLEVKGKTVLKFALCYGFRNLQNVVRRIKSGKCDYHFLEIMACPAGCLNGGGQIKPKPGQSPKELIQLLEAAYMENVRVADPFKNPLVKSLYDEWLEKPGSEKAKRFVHTEYHPVVKSITSQLHNW